MILGVQVIFVFQQQVERQTIPAGPDLVIQDEIGVQKLRIEMRLATGVVVSSVGHAIGGKGARRRT